MMKTLCIAMTMAVTALVVQADLIDGGFDGSLVVNQSNMADSNSDLGLWYSFATSDWLISGGRLVRDATVGTTGARRAAQIFDADLTTGDYTLNLDYAFVGELGDVTVTMLYYADTGTDSALTYGSRQEGYRDTFYTGTRGSYDVSVLDTQTIATGTYTGTDVLSFNIGSDMADSDKLMVVFDTINLSSSDTISFDNVSIGTAAIPEPTTFGMFGFGALMAMAIRRARA